MFFQCIGALINPANDTRRNVKLGLLAYTVALFAFSTISLGVTRDLWSTVFIDIRNFPGTEEYPPGPIGSAFILGANVALTALILFSDVVNQWLSDGLLVSFIWNSAACARYTYSSSYIVAMSFIP